MPADLHLSHVIIEDNHTPLMYWVCTACSRAACSICPLPADHPLARPCEGEDGWLS